MNKRFPDLPGWKAVIQRVQGISMVNSDVAIKETGPGYLSNHQAWQLHERLGVIAGPHPIHLEVYPACLKVTPATFSGSYVGSPPTNA